MHTYIPRLCPAAGRGFDAACGWLSKLQSATMGPYPRALSL